MPPVVVESETFVSFLAAHALMVSRVIDGLLDLMKYWDAC